MVIFEKHSDTWDLTIIELIETTENHNTVITINYSTFLFWDISFRVCYNACIITRLRKNHFHQFSLSVFKMNDTVNFEDNFFVHF